MQKLKTLIDSGTDIEILEYVKGQFQEKIDGYIEVIDDTERLHKEGLRLTQEGEARRLALDDYRSRVDAVLSRMEENQTIMTLWMQYIKESPPQHRTVMGVGR